MENYGTFFYFPHAENEVYEKFRSEAKFPVSVGIFNEANCDFETVLTIRETHPALYMRSILIQGTDLGKAIADSVKCKTGFVKAREEYPFYKNSKSNPRYIQTVLGDYNGHFLHEDKLSDLLLAIDDIGLECYCFAYELTKFPSHNFSWKLLGVVLTTDKDGDGRVGLDKDLLNQIRGKFL